MGFVVLYFSIPSNSIVDVNIVVVVASFLCRSSGAYGLLVSEDGNKRNTWFMNGDSMGVKYEGAASVQHIHRPCKAGQTE